MRWKKSGEEDVFQIDRLDDKQYSILLQAILEITDLKSKNRMIEALLRIEESHLTMKMADKMR